MDKGYTIKGQVIIFGPDHKHRGWAVNIASTAADYVTGQATRATNLDAVCLAAGYEHELERARTLAHEVDGMTLELKILREMVAARAKGQTVAVYDLSPAQVEGAVRDKLIELGWTPPDAKPTPNERDTARLDFFIGRRVTWYTSKDRGRRPGGNGQMWFDDGGLRREIEAQTLRDALDVGIDLFGGKP